MTDDADLLDDYVRRGREASKASLEAAWLEYELRAYVLSLLPKRRPLAVCNAGIWGVWDDWLGHVVGSRITSVDRDADRCRFLVLRQQREGHPYPAEAICGDVCADVLGDRRFDIITCMRSVDDEGRTYRALQRFLAPSGLLLRAEIGRGAGADRVRTCGDVWLACMTRTCPS